MLSDTESLEKIAKIIEENPNCRKLLTSLLIDKPTSDIREEIAELFVMASMMHPASFPELKEAYHIMIKRFGGKERLANYLGCTRTRVWRKLKIINNPGKYKKPKKFLSNNNNKQYLRQKDGKYKLKK